MSEEDCQDGKPLVLLARIAELEAELAKWRDAAIEQQRQRRLVEAEVARLREMFRLDGEMHAAAVRAARHEQDARLAAYKSRITELEQIELETETKVS